MNGHHFTPKTNLVVVVLRAGSIDNASPGCRHYPSSYGFDSIAGESAVRHRRTANVVACDQSGVRTKTIEQIVVATSITAADDAISAFVRNVDCVFSRQ
jgi:hypothetical protein